MGIKIGFVTGARSEYGIAKKLLRSLREDENFDLSIFPTGMHLLKKFGYSVSEIIADGFPIDTLIKAYRERGDEKVYEFTNTVNKVYKILTAKKLDAIFIIGDRLEAYAAALVAHFLKIPLIHLGGGAITPGTVDNIYRYNITYLSTIHLASSKNHYQRLLQLEAIEKGNIHFVGSPAIDAIVEFKKNPVSITKFFHEIETGRFALMTFHPVTLTREPIHKIMDVCIQKVLNNRFNVLLTYPNNDEGHADIIRIIDKWRGHKKVFVSRSLGSQGYYSALHCCSFVIGNSSSGLIEAPYFDRAVLNIGSRQDGRDRDVGVKDVSADINLVAKELEGLLARHKDFLRCNYIYGDGNSVKRIKEVISDFFKI